MAWRVSSGGYSFFTLLVCMLALGGCGDASSGGDSASAEAPFGLLLPLSGEYAWLGEARNGARVALEETNEEGPGLRIGAAQAEIVLFTEDTAGVSETAEAGAKKLLDENKVVALIGPTSYTILSVVPVAREGRVVEISPCAGTTALDQRGGCVDDECVFRTVSSDVVMGSGMAWFAKEELTAKKVAFFFVDDAGAKSISGVLEDAVRVLALDVVGKVLFQRGKSSYLQELETALAGKPDVIFFESSAQDAAVFLQEWEAGRFGGQWVGTDFVNDALATQAEPFNEGVFGVKPEPVLDERFAEWVEKYERIIGSYTIAPFAPNTYDAVILVALALEKGGEISRTAVREHLRGVATPPGETCRSFAACAALLRQGEEIDYDGISGAQDFNEFGDPVSPLAVEQVQNGALVRRRGITPNDIGDVIEAVLDLREGNSTAMSMDSPSG